MNIAETLTRVDTILTINAHTVAGFKMFNCLLDQHPKLLTLPGDSSQLLYQFYQKNAPLFADWAQQQEQLTVAVLNQLDSLFIPEKMFHHPKGLGRLGPNKDQQPCVSPTAFSHHFKQIMNCSISLSVSGKFIRAVYLAFYAAANIEVSEASIVVFVNHKACEYLYQFAHQDFITVKYLYLTRRPAIAIASSLSNNMRFFQNIRSENVPYNILSNELKFNAVGNDVKLPFPLTKENFFMTKLEDIHYSPEKVLTKLCQWLNIKYLPCLHETTIMGLTWWNRPTSQQVSGINKSISENKHRHIMTQFDHFRLFLLLIPRYCTWHYIPRLIEYMRPIIAVLLWPFLLIPFKCELLDHQRRNRIQVKALLAAHQSIQTTKLCEEKFKDIKLVGKALDAYLKQGYFIKKTIEHDIIIDQATQQVISKKSSQPQIILRRDGQEKPADVNLKCMLVIAWKIILLFCQGKWFTTITGYLLIRVLMLKYLFSTNKEFP